MSESGATPSPYSEERWIAVAVTYAAERGYTYSNECLADLSSFLRGAAANLRAAEAAENPDKLLQDVKRLVRLMIDERIAEDSTSTTLQEWTLTQAKLKFCPLFPFC